MKRQFRYAWEDILSHKFKYFILFLQISAAVVLVSYIFVTIFNAYNFKDKLNEVMQGQEEEIYTSRDISSSERINDILLDQDNIKRLGELYEFIKKNPSFKTYTADMQHSMWLPEGSIGSSFAEDPKYNPDVYFLLKIDEEFQDVFKLKCVKGRIFSNEDFEDTGNEIHLLLGYDFQKYYKLDDVIYDYMEQCYRVVGFLEKSSFHLNPGWANRVIWLDRAFVVPIQPDKIEDTIYYSSAICSTFIITDDTTNLQSIQEKSNELGLYTFEFTSFTDWLQDLSKRTIYGIMVTGFIMTIILIFAIIAFISNLIQFINTLTKEFAIHLLCGGRIISIIQRILIQVFLVIFIADIIVLIIHKFSLVTLLTIAMSLIIGLIIIIYPVILLSKTQINNILKRSQ